MTKVIGTYRCGCDYGPIKKSERLEYCAIHGEDIQQEYIWTKANIAKELNKLKDIDNKRKKSINNS